MLVNHKKIFSERSKKDISVSKMSAATNIPRCVYYDIENGKVKDPSADHLKAICKVLGITVASVLNEAYI